MWFVFTMLANALFSGSDVSVSMAINRFERSPMTIACFLAVCELVLLAILAVFVPPDVRWLGMFAIAGVTAYCGMIAFLFVLSRVDVSVSSAAWVFMTLAIAFGGIVFFDETLAPHQVAGAALSIVGVIVLSFWHKHVSLVRTCLMLAIPGLLFAPIFLIKKAALLSGVSVYTAFFWPVLFQKSCALLTPMILASERPKLSAVMERMNGWFLSMIAVSVLCNLLGTYVITVAYDLGQASFVALAENGQPFFLMFFAWLATLAFPRHAPRELLTAQSVGTKVVSFLMVFGGLSLLAIS